MKNISLVGGLDTWQPECIKDGATWVGRAAGMTTLLVPGRDGAFPHVTPSSGVFTVADVDAEKVGFIELHGGSWEFAILHDKFVVMAME
eukprot:991589-Rhodomonas_salina.1